MYLYKVCESFGRVRNKHKLKINYVQNRCINKWHTTRSVEYRKKCAIKKKKFIVTQQARLKNREKETYRKKGDRQRRKKQNKTTVKRATPKPKTQTTFQKNMRVLYAVKNLHMLNVRS